MTHIPDSIGVASLRTHRLILTVANGGEADVFSNFSKPELAAILRAIADSYAPANAGVTCLDELFTGRPCADHAATASDPTRADDPIPLRWGLDDVLHGDDDTVTVCLSGPAPRREPYALELGPERAQALRAALAPFDSRPAPSEDVIALVRAELAAIEEVHDQLDCECEADASAAAVRRVRAVLDAHCDPAAAADVHQGDAVAAVAAVERVLAWCDDLDRAVRLRHMDPDAEHPHAIAVRTVIAQDGTL
ncbi:hypothetical protein ACGFZH_20980 [Streptomyces zaomyceticus]|uniref:hypothetical protein n=1 Tax=Streptomyces zaomyceticus TaxID=68286 RepID=UPI00371E2D80